MTRSSPPLRNSACERRLNSDWATTPVRTSLRRTARMSVPTWASSIAQPEDAQDLLVGQAELALRIDHAKPMRHIVERGIEARRERRDHRSRHAATSARKVSFRRVEDALMNRKSGMNPTMMVVGGIQSACSATTIAALCRNERIDDQRVDALVQRKASRPHAVGALDGRDRREAETERTAVGHPKGDQRPRASRLM